MSSAVAVLGLFLPAAGAVLTWWFSERSKLQWQQYERKERSYAELLRCLQGFYVSTEDRDLKAKFLQQVNLLWLYADDAVIRSAYLFLGTVETGARTSEDQKRLACGELVAAIRHDLLARRVVDKTALQASDFRHLRAT